MKGKKDLVEADEHHDPLTEVEQLIHVNLRSLSQKFRCPSYQPIQYVSLKEINIY
jgi:hypothetical protein